MVDILFLKVRHAVDHLIHDRMALCDSIVTNFFSWLPDKPYLELRYRFLVGKWPNLKNPQTFNEKINWIKIFYRRPELTMMVDKYSVKSYVSSKIGKEYVIPTIGLWDTPNEIDWDSLPPQFVLKTTHGGGNTGVVICRDKSQFDKDSAIAKLNSSLQQNIYKYLREWPYKDVPRRIIAEEYIEDEKTKELRDYKFFCFNGVVKALFVASERQKRSEPFFNFFDENYNSLDFKQGHPRADIPPEKPNGFEEMKRIAATLSEGIPHVRVDLYQANGKIYFGELTFCHFGGMVPFEPEEWDYKFGEWLNLPQK